MMKRDAVRTWEWRRFEFDTSTKGLLPAPQQNYPGTV